MRSVLRAAAIAATAMPAMALAHGAVEVTITNVRDGVGTINAELCPERNWLKSCAIQRVVPAHAGTTVVIFPDVPPGRYGAVAFHDHNRNGKADRNLLGIPTEDVGFSNNALKRLAPPKYSDAAFEHGEGAQRITFAMHRF